MSRPHIVAIAGTTDYVLRDHRILFRGGFDHGGMGWLIDYNNKNYRSEVAQESSSNKECALHIEETYSELRFDTNDVPILNDKVLKFIKELESENECGSHPVYIPFHNNNCERWIVYYSAGNSCIVSETEILDVCYDENTSYQSGDGCCALYNINNGDKLIVNYGDVESCILFTSGVINVYEYKNLHTEETCENTKRCKLCSAINNKRYMKLIHGLKNKREKLSNYQIDRDHI
jgi:hypothetical protein